jgi:hypothetical protein
MQAVYGRAGVSLVVISDPCSTKDVWAFQKDGLRFGLLRMASGYCWLLRTGFASFDAPYCPNLLGVAPAPWVGVEIPPNSRLNLNMHLIDGKGIARALKLITVSTEFTQKLVAIHDAMPPMIVPLAKWDAEINELHQRYPDPNNAFKDAAVSCKGGV